VSNTGVSSGYRIVISADEAVSVEPLNGVGRRTIQHRKSHGGINGALAFSSSVAQAAAPFIAALI
jgi:hypothetical protein